MLADAQDHPVHGVFVAVQDTGNRPDAHTLSGMVDDLPDQVSGQMQSEKCGPVVGCKPASTGATVQ